MARATHRQCFSGPACADSVEMQNTTALALKRCPCTAFRSVQRVFLLLAQLLDSEGEGFWTHEGIEDMSWSLADGAKLFFAEGSSSGSCSCLLTDMLESR